MGRLRALLLLSFLVCSLDTIKAQTAPTLQVGNSIERSLGKGEVHEFVVQMEEKGFAQLFIEQRGIDVLITLSSPDGKPIREFDTPNGAEGQELVTFVASNAGAYRIAVRPLEANNPVSGRYQIKLVELREATDQEIKTSKNREEAQQKGIALLAEMDGLISQVKSPLTRIQAQLRVAYLLWDFDEKRASRYLSAAVAEAKEFIALVNASVEEYPGDYQIALQLRYQVVQSLAAHDPDAALDFLHSTAPRPNVYTTSRELTVQENTLELSIADQLVNNDPNRAALIVRQNLKKGYSQSVFNTLAQIANKNRELAMQLAHEITGKILGESKLSDQAEAANVAMALIRSYRQPGENTIQTQTRDVKGSVQAGLISEEDCKQLVQKLLAEVLSYKQTRMYSPTRDAIWAMMAGLQAMGPELDKFVAGGTAALSKKQTEAVGRSFVSFSMQEYQDTVTSGPVETALETIEKAPAEAREQLYLQLANREAGNGDFTRARQIINEHVSNPYQRAESLRNLEQQEIAGAMSKGKIEEALRNIAAIRNPQERASQIAQVASQIGERQKGAIAVSQLEQVRSLLGSAPHAQDNNQMRALLEIARAFGNHDSKRSFEIIEPLIDQFNEICMAARILEGFGTEFYQNEELNMHNGNVVSQLAQEFSNVLGSLALVNFDRAKSASDKIRLPEVRLQTYLEIATQTIKE